MKEDRLWQDKAEIHNLDDLIDARDDKRSHIGADIDAIGEDIDISDVDVDDALTFPHPKRKKPDVPVLMGEPYEIDMDEDWAAQDIQPSDYEHDYNEVTDTHATDNPDEIAEERLHEIGHMDVEDTDETPAIEVMPSRFSPEEPQ